MNSHVFPALVQIALIAALGVWIWKGRTLRKHPRARALCQRVYSVMVGGLVLLNVLAALILAGGQ